MSTYEGLERVQGDPEERDEYQREIESEYKGDSINTPKGKNLRIGFLNIRGIPKINKHAKNEDTRGTINGCCFDHIGMAEINCQWNKIPIDQQLRQRTKDWWRCSIGKVTYNKKDHNTSAYQPGGALSLTIGDATHRVFQTGIDDLLGRWCWTTF